MRPGHPLPFAAAVLAGSLAVGCDVPDRALSPVAPPPTDAQLEGSPTSVYAVTQGFRKAITVAGIQTHLDAFNAIAQQNGGVRASFDASHTATAEYVRAKLASAGFNATIQTFQFDYGGDLTPPEFSRISPSPRTITPVREFLTMSYSGSGDVTAILVPVDLEIPSIGGNTSGCEASDFAGFPAGAIALVQRSTCDFRVKALNAAAAGARAVIVMNEGNTPERQDVVNGTLSAPSVSIPVIGTSYAIGVELAEMPEPVVHIKVNASTGAVSSSNVIAETADGDPNNVVVVGASLDGRFGPAINATSGGAALLEIARVYAAQERASRNRTRFVWFGALPEGGFGASYYVSQLTADERAKVRAMIEIGPIGSPNFGRFVYDGDRPGTLPTDPAADATSGKIEALLNDYFAVSQLGVNSATWQTNVRAFREVGIPIDGVMSGLADVKTAAQADLFGGVAGVAFDPCHMLPCDGLANISTTALDQLSDAAAHLVLTLARRNFATEPLVQN